VPTVAVRTHVAHGAGALVSRYPGGNSAPGRHQHHHSCLGEVSYSHAIVGVSPHDYGRAMVGYICPTHTVSVTYKLGVTAAGMTEHASLLGATEGKRPIAAPLSVFPVPARPPDSGVCCRSIFIYPDDISLGKATVQRVSQANTTSEQYSCQSFPEPRDERDMRAWPLCALPAACAPPAVCQPIPSL
jgi:hypothetical protein